MAIINERSGYFGFTVDGLDGTIDENGCVDRIIFAITYPIRNKGIEFTISTGANDWGAQMADGGVIPLSSPKVLFKNRNNAIVQFTMGTRYPSNSPGMLIYRSDTASYSVKETDDELPFTVNSMTGYFATTVEGYEGITDSSGRVNRLLATIPFPVQSVSVTFSISSDPSHWGARMPNGDIITLRNPVVIFTNSDNAVVVFEMDSSYPSNTPCILVYRSKDASINIEAQFEEIFIPVNDITGIPDSIEVGKSFNLINTIIEPINASNQTISWRLVNGYATLSGTVLTPTAAGSIIVAATITNGASDNVNYTKSFTIRALPATITIVKQPVSYVSVPYNKITGSMDTLATIPVGSVSYQWYQNTSKDTKTGTMIPGATSASYPIPTSLVAGSHYFYCVISGTGGALSVTTDIIEVYVSVPVTAIAILNKPSTIPVGTQKELAVTVYPSNADNQTIVWSTSNTAIATVSNGIVTAKAIGSVTIYARSSDGAYTDSCTITVTEFIPVTNIVGVPILAIVGEPLSLGTALVVPGTASMNTIRWSILNDFGTDAILSNDQLLIPLTTGNNEMCTIRAVIENGLAPGINYTQDFRISVEYPFTPVERIVLVKYYAKAEETLPIEAGVAPSNATNKTVIWSIYNDGETGAALNNSDLTLVATNPGVVTLMGRVVNGSSETRDFTQNIQITISEQQIPVTEITDVVTSVEVGETTMLAGTVSPPDATYQDIIWSIVSDTPNSIGATLTENGEFYASRTGSIEVLATVKQGVWDGGDEQDSANGVDFEQRFTISVIKFVKVTNISNVPEVIPAGNTYTLNAIVAPENATNQNITWSIVSAGSTGATISGNKLTAKNTGTVKIRATIKNGLSQSSGFGGMFGGSSSSDYTQEFTIEVKEAIVPVQHISGIPESISVGSYTLVPTIEPTNATNKVISWSITDAGIVRRARIEGNVLIGESPGTITISAVIVNGLDFGSNYQQDFVVTFEGDPVDTIELDGFDDVCTVTVNQKAAPGDTVTVLLDNCTADASYAIAVTDMNGSTIPVTTVVQDRLFTFTMVDDYPVTLHLIYNPAQ